MKSFDSRAYSVNDFVEWESTDQLELNPIFQRRSVWTEKAKSFLMDTLIRGKPIPKVFIRQKINVLTKKSTREVVDGQQRLRTILLFIKDGFTINKAHNVEYGGLFYSQLPELIQSQLLSYEIAVDLLINLPDSEILDIFSRLNSYSVTLNDQEKINADHFGPFKALADKIGHKYNDYWIRQSILTPKKIVRMAEVNLVADLLIATIEGIKAKNKMAGYYNFYEDEFDYDPRELETKFDTVIKTIVDMYPEGLSNSELKRLPVFYSLYTAIYHCIYGLKNFDHQRIDLSGSKLKVARNGLDKVDILFSTDIAFLSDKEREFRLDSRQATTDESVRKRRTEFLLSYMR